MISLRERGNIEKEKAGKVGAKVAKIENIFEHAKFEVSIIYSRRDVQQAIK